MLCSCSNCTGNIDETIFLFLFLIVAKSLMILCISNTKAVIFGFCGILVSLFVAKSLMVFYTVEIVYNDGQGN